MSSLLVGIPLISPTILAEVEVDFRVHSEDRGLYWVEITSWERIDGLPEHAKLDAAVDRLQEDDAFIQRAVDYANSDWDDYP